LLSATPYNEYELKLKINGNDNGKRQIPRQETLSPATIRYALGQGAHISRPLVTCAPLIRVAHSPFMNKGEF
jgi:hypothetical protein